MRNTTWLPIALVLFALPVCAQPAPGAARQQYRCEVPYFTGATAPQGVSVKMTVVSDGLACVIPNWGVPDDRRNPATAGDITDASQHGTAVFFSPTARYIADRGYVGPDAFAYRATVRDGEGLERVMTVRVEVDVRAAPFDRTPGAGRVNVLIPDGPIRVGNDVPVPRKTRDVRPAPSPEALTAGIKGAVILDATIGPDGRVSSARVIRSIPLLDAAAVAAVRQWEFTPTVIDGRAVPVIMTVSANFAAPAASERAPAPSERAPAPTVANAGAPAVDADLEAALQYLQRRQYDDALKAFRQLNDRRGEKCAVCYVGMARAYESLGAAKNVVESCDRAVAVAGDDKTAVVQARQLKAVALQDLGQGKDPKRLRQAEDELSAALALDPAANYLHFNLGLVLLREGRDADGVAELKAELAIRPNGPQADRARSMIENPRRAREAFAPRFSVVTMDRELVDLDSLKGKVVLLDFWGTWCPPCVAAIPTLRDLQKKHAKDPFVLFSVSSDTDEAVVRAFTEKNHIVWPQYWDRDRKVQQSFDVRAFPTYVLIDDEGVVQFRTTGGGLHEPLGLEDAIKKALKAAVNRGGRPALP